MENAKIQVMREKKHLRRYIQTCASARGCATISKGARALRGFAQERLALLDKGPVPKTGSTDLTRRQHAQRRQNKLKESLAKMDEKIKAAEIEITSLPTNRSRPARLRFGALLKKRVQIEKSIN